MSISTTRRGLLAASAWAVPTVVVASTTPAFAASLCPPDTSYTVNWGGVADHPYTYTPAADRSPYASGAGRIQAIPLAAGLTATQVAAMAPLTVTVTNTVPTSGTTNRMRGGSFTYSGSTFSNMRVTSNSVSGFGHRGLALAQEMDGSASSSQLPLSNHRQELTLAFSRPVKGLSFRIGDIDATSGNHSDRVTVEAQAPTIVRGTGVRGNGTGTADGANNTAGHLVGPFRPTGSGIVNDATGTAGNVTVTYGGDTTLSTVRIRFWSNVNDGGMQWIFLSNLSFKAATC